MAHPIASRPWIERHLITIVETIANEGPQLQTWIDSARLEITALMSLAKINGIIIDRKQSVTANLDVPVSAGELQSHIAGYLDTLAPGERKQIEQRLKALEDRPARKGAKATPPPVVVDTDAEDFE